MWKGCKILNKKIAEIYSAVPARVLRPGLYIARTVGY